MTPLTPGKSVYLNKERHTILEIQGVHVLLIKDSQIGGSRRFVRVPIRELQIQMFGRLRDVGEFGWGR